MSLFITFEGIEGSGKTTQIKLLSKYLKSKGVDHILTREPGGTEFGDGLRKLVLIPRAQPIEPFCELFVMLAARQHHVAGVIGKNLKKGKTVLCDRFTDATVAYQGGGRGIDIPLIKKLNNLATNNIKPDLTILFDLPSDEGLKRSKKRLSKIASNKRESRFEDEKSTFHKKVRKSYLDIAHKEKKRFFTVNALEDIQSIHNKIVTIVDHELKKHIRARRGKKRTSSACKKK